MKVLVIEDDAGHLKIVQRGLTDAGFVCDVAKTGREGRDMLAGAGYDIVVLDRMLPDADVLTLSGSLPPDLGADVYRDLIDIAHSYGVRVILDADGDALRKGIRAKPYAVKPNFAEFRSLVGKDVQTVSEIVSAARELTARGIELVAVSCGANGAVFVQGTQAVRTVPFPIAVGSAAAAGDSMVAALAWSLVQGLTLIETAKLMTAAGTCTASLAGTQVAPLAEAIARASDVRVQIPD